MITLYGGNTICEMPISVLEPHPGPLLVTSDSKSPEKFLGYPIFFLCFKLGISQLLGPPIFGISQLFSNCNLGISQLFLRVVLQIVKCISWDIPTFSSPSFLQIDIPNKNQLRFKNGLKPEPIPITIQNQTFDAK